MVRYISICISQITYFSSALFPASVLFMINSKSSFLSMKSSSSSVGVIAQSSSSSEISHKMPFDYTNRIRSNKINT